MRVKAVVSFNGLVKGDEGDVELTERIMSLVDGGYLVGVGGGSTASRPGRFEKSDQEREPVGAGADGSAGGEQGEDPLSG